MRVCWSWIFAAVLTLGCSSNTSINDDITPVVDTVQVKVFNNRSPEVYEPLFRLVSDRGNQIWIGRVGSSTVRTIEVDKTKLQPGECFIAVVHFTGTPDIRYPSFCWMGENHIDITLNEIISTSTAWSHQ